MSNLSGLKIKSQKALTVVACMVTAALASVPVFAEGTEVTTFDVVSTVTASFSDVVSTLLLILAGVVASAMVVIGAKIGITKGIQFFKTLAGKA